MKGGRRKSKVADRRDIFKEKKEKKRNQHSRPPAHTLIAIHDFANAISAKLGICRLPTSLALKLGPINGQIQIFEHIAFKERTNRTRPDDTSFLKEFSPSLQTNLIHIIDDIIEIELRKLRSQRTNERDLKTENLRQSISNMFLFRIIVINSIESNRTSAHINETSLSAPLRGLEQRTGCILDVDRINFQVFGVKQDQILLEIDMNSRETNARSEVAGVIGTVDVGQAQGAVLQTGNFA